MPLHNKKRPGDEPGRNRFVHAGASAAVAEEAQHEQE
jgi:hypothetical protein